MMQEDRAHITVCICTFKRPRLLRRLLDMLQRQHTEGLFTYSAVVVDNDATRSAEEVVGAFRETVSFEVRYCCETEQNIALARNAAVEHAAGEFVAFIDDDEFPTPWWLFNLYKAWKRFKVDGVLGPVWPYYETKPPQWLVKGKFYARGPHPTGTVLSWTQTRTGNVLLKREIFTSGILFRAEFGSGGEDRDFFRRAIRAGRSFVWCAEAPVYEHVPPERWKRSFMVRRALMRGQTPYNHNIVAYGKSFMAIPLYTILLPFMLPQHHLFMKYLVSYFDHIGRILFLLGWNVIKHKYIMK